MFLSEFYYDPSILISIYQAIEIYYIYVYLMLLF